MYIFEPVNFPRYVVFHNPAAPPGRYNTVIERLYVTGTMHACAYSREYLQKNYMLYIHDTYVR